MTTPGIFFPLPRTISWDQWLYIYVNGFFTAFLSAAFNIFIIRQMYSPRFSTSFWGLFAEDLAVICFVQSITALLIVPNAVLADLHSNEMIPLLESWPRIARLPDQASSLDDWMNKMRPHGQTRQISYYARSVLRFCAGETDDMGFFELGRLGRKPGIRGVLERLVWSIAQVVLWGTVLFALFWPITTAIIALVYSGRSMTAGDNYLEATQEIMFFFAWAIGAFRSFFLALQILGGQVEVPDDDESDDVGGHV